MQKNLLNSSSIRLQIAKGGTNDLQFHLNRYRVSVHYTTSKPYRLIAVVVANSDYDEYCHSNRCNSASRKSVRFCRSSEICGRWFSNRFGYRNLRQHHGEVVERRSGDDCTRSCELGDVLSAINVSSGGNAIPTNNLPQKGGDGWSGMERAFEKAIMKMPVPVVSVVDINAGQRRVKVSENLGQLGGRRNRK